MLNPNELYKLSELAISAAYEAGSLICKFKNNSYSIEVKDSGISDASRIVTEVDRLSQEVILNKLSESLDIYKLGLLTEELKDDSSRFIEEYFWCIDPLDGTLSFVNSFQGFAVSIALVSKSGVPLIGVVYDPVKKALYHAIKGKGVYKNHAPFKLEYNERVFTIVMDKSFSKHPANLLAKSRLEGVLYNKGYSFIELAGCGGAVINAVSVLEEAPACYFKLPRKEQSGGCIWDYAATSCIFNEVGAYAGDVYGRPLELNKKASPFMNEKGVLYLSNNEFMPIVIEELCT